MLSIPAFLDGNARQWWTTNRGQWMLVSYMYCLETSTGATLRVSAFRVVGTLFGVSYGLFTVREPYRGRSIAQCSPVPPQWYVSTGNRFALAFLISIADVPASWLMASHAALELVLVTDTA